MQIESTKDQAITDHTVQNGSEVDLARWMSDLWPSLSSLRVHQIALPGSHDSATSHLSCSDASHDNCGALLHQLPCCIRQCVTGCIWPVLRPWSVTQPLTVSEQLQMGVRYFDLRASWDAVTMQARVAHGTVGVLLEEVFGQVAHFLQSFEGVCRELLILDINHMYNFDREAHLSLIGHIDQLLAPWLVPSDSHSSCRLGDLPPETRVMLLYGDEGKRCCK